MRRRAAGALGAALACGARLALAQPAAPPLAYWHHTAWTGDAAPPRAGSHRMLATGDGYVWLSAIGALLRFDGARFTIFDSANTPALASHAQAQLFPMLVDGSRMLAHGTDGVVLAFRDGRFSAVATDARLDDALRRDGSGRLWTISGDSLLRWVDGRLVAPGIPGLPTHGIWSLQRDAGEGLWVGTVRDGLWHLVGSSAERVLASAEPIRTLLHARDGTVWTVSNGSDPGVGRLDGARWSPVTLPGVGRMYATWAVEDADGAVWFQTNATGIARWRDGAFERFTKRDGLSSDRVHDIVVDPEGAVWVTTDAGLDRIRPSAFAMLDERHGLPNSAGYQFDEDASGAIWLSCDTTKGFHLLDDGIVRRRGGRVSARWYPSPGGGSELLLAAARDGGVWLAPLSGGLALLRADRRRDFGAADGVPAVRFSAGAVTSDGALWARTSDRRLGRLRDGRFRFVPLGIDARLGKLAGDRRGRLWVTYPDRPTLTVVERDTVVAHVALPLPAGTGARALAAEGVDTMWAATTRSLIRVVGERVSEVQVPALTTILVAGSEIAISRGWLWVVSAAGIARVSLAELHAAASDAHAPAPRAIVVDAADGLPTARSASMTPGGLRVARDGRVWIATPEGLAVADPSLESRPPRAPHLHVESIVADGRAQALEGPIAIAPNPDRVVVRFTAASLHLPERVRLQYRLAGADREWIDATPSREAAYAQLRPGTYRFHLRAWADDRVAAPTEASLAFDVGRAWYQQWWSYALAGLAVVAAVAALAMLVQRRRARASTARMEARFEAALAERTRIAGELHDTLLQGFAGLTLHLEGVRGKIVQQPHTAADELTGVLQRADAALREARTAVWDMRAPALETTDLIGALEAAGTRALNGDEVALRYVVTGARRRLPPAIETTALRIGSEAIANALRHADPTTVVVELTYEPARVVLDVRDDGRGADARDIETATATGHWGVAGMRERAQRAGGTVEVETARGRGTRVRVTLPTGQGG